MASLQWKMDSRIGPVYVVASELGVQSILFQQQPAPLIETLDSSDPATLHISETVRQLNEYFAGARQTFDLKFDIKGTAFQRQVWTALAQIPYGSTCSYRDIAKNVQNEKAVRAVGSANGKNPLCIVVPCHRVIAADGTLGGYSGGLPFKTKLLEIERADQIRQIRSDLSA